MIDEGVPFGRQADPGAVADEQGRAERFLQFPHPLGNAGLRQAELAGGGAEAAEPDDAVERF